MSSTGTTEGEFRVPEAGDDLDPSAGAPDGDGHTEGDDVDSARPGVLARLRRRRGGSTPDDAAARAEPADLSDVDLAKTPGTVVAAVALGVVAAPLLAVYAVLFVTRWFLQPGVAPDITGSWLGEGIAGIVAAVLAVALMVVVARTAAGRSPRPFLVAQALVLATCIYLLTDDANGGAGVSVVVGLMALAAAVCALLPTSRRWFAAHAADL